MVNFTFEELGKYFFQVLVQDTHSVVINGNLDQVFSNFNMYVYLFIYFCFLLVFNGIGNQVSQYDFNTEGISIKWDFLVYVNTKGGFLICVRIQVNQFW
ncbi:hypothetical protein D3C87_1201010 [compost metagenome]